MDSTPAHFMHFTVYDPQAPAELIEAAKTRPLAERATLRLGMKDAVPGLLIGGYASQTDVGQDLMSLPIGWIASSVGVMYGMRVVSERRQHRKAVRRQKQAAEQVERVRTVELASEVRDLLKRTRAAKDAVLGAHVHKDGLLDKERNEVALAEQEWVIAKQLRDYTEAAKDVDGIHGAQTLQLRTAVSARRKALRVALNAVKRKVEALEEYAHRAKVLDVQHREIQQALKITSQDDSLVKLLASTAADDMYLNEIKQLNDQTKGLSEAFTTSLQETREAAKNLLEITA